MSATEERAKSHNSLWGKKFLKYLKTTPLVIEVDSLNEILWLQEVKLREDKLAPHIEYM